MSEQNIKEIARNLRSTPSKVSSAIDKLIALGLIKEHDTDAKIDTEKGYTVEGK